MQDNSDLSLWHEEISTFVKAKFDAEKCFDLIWHDGLFYKLWSSIPLPHCHWLLLYRWYSNPRCLARWNGDYSQPFRVTRGTRQGIIIVSPFLFNIFIDDLLSELNKANAGL